MRIDTNNLKSSQHTEDVIIKRGKMLNLILMRQHNKTLSQVVNNQATKLKD